MPPRLPNDARGMVAVIIAAAAGLSVLVLALGTAWAIIHTKLNVPPEVSTLMSTALGALIGSVGTYLGFRNQPNRRDEEKP